LFLSKPICSILYFSTGVTMNRILVLLPMFVCCLISNSDLIGQTPPPPPGCPSELVWTDGTIYVYDKVLCTTLFGGTCAWSAVPGIVFYDQIVTTGCKMGAGSCKCATDVEPLGHGGGGPVTMDVNGRPDSKYNHDRIPSFEEYVGKLDKSETWFKFYKLKLASKPDALPKTSQNLRVCVLLTNPPVKCTGSNSPCTPASQFKTGLSIEATKIVSGQPSEVTVKDTSAGGLTEVYNVVFQ
jgi:hypothetical protein